MASRTRRLTRFRTTAFPIARGTVKPILGPAQSGRQPFPCVTESHVSWRVCDYLVERYVSAFGLIFQYRGCRADGQMLRPTMSGSARDKSAGGFFTGRHQVFLRFAGPAIALNW